MLKLSNIQPDIYEVFAITKLNKLFDIRDDEAAALVVRFSSRLPVMQAECVFLRNASGLFGPGFSRALQHRNAHAY